MANDLPVRVVSPTTKDYLFKVCGRDKPYMGLDVVCPERGNKSGNIRITVTAVEWGETPTTWNIKGYVLRVFGTLASEAEFANQMTADGYPFRGSVATSKDEPEPWLKIQLEGGV